MKQIYVADILKQGKLGSTITIQGWVKTKRKQGKILFLDFCDSTGDIQLVINQADVTNKLLETIKHTPPESAVQIKGQIQETHNKHKEIVVKNFTIIGSVNKQFCPQPRSNFNIFDPNQINNLLTNRHIYIRNPKIMAILRFRHILIKHIRQWFEENRFIEIHAPILTPIPLYDDGSAIAIRVHNEDVFLTQCVGYYLEATVHAFERVYNMGPSFRGEESRSKRHLMEYWHVKAEIAFGNLEDMMVMVEEIVSYITQKCKEESQDILNILNTKLCLDGLKIPFSRIKYEDAIKHLQNKGFDIKFGKGLGSSEEEELSKMFDGPFWVTNIPCVVEPFPYVIHPKDKRVTMVADLIASNGYGELLGTAEKIYDLDMLDKRLKDKGKLNDSRYEWVREVHQIGCVPHIAFGMGVERFIRWLLNIPHVRDAIPFPRIFRRRIRP